MNRLPLLLMFLAIPGCGGGDERTPTAEETARAWVDAVNAEDYERACDISFFFPKADCLNVLKQAPFGQDLKAVGFTAGGTSPAGRAEVTFAIASPLESKREAGVTTYAPFHIVEDDEGELRVSWWDTVVPGADDPGSRRRSLPIGEAG